MLHAVEINTAINVTAICILAPIAMKGQRLKQKYSILKGLNETSLWKSSEEKSDNAFR